MATTLRLEAGYIDAGPHTTTSTVHSATCWVEECLGLSLAFTKRETVSQDMSFRRQENSVLNIAEQYGGSSLCVGGLAAGSTWSARCHVGLSQLCSWIMSFTVRRHSSSGWPWRCPTLSSGNGSGDGHSESC